MVNSTRRTFKPNVQSKALRSEVLDREMKLRVTTHALRSIYKAGGLDEWLVSSKFVDDSEVGRKLREEILERVKASPQTIPKPRPNIRLPRNRLLEKEQEQQRLAGLTAGAPAAHGDTSKREREPAASSALQPGSVVGKTLA